MPEKKERKRTTRQAAEKGTTEQKPKRTRKTTVAKTTPKVKAAAAGAPRALRKRAVKTVKTTLPPVVEAGVQKIKAEMRRVEESQSIMPPPKEYWPVPEQYQLPSGYGENKIVLLVRDPYWLYAYWEVTPSTCEQIKIGLGEETFSNSKLVLRVYDITGIQFNGHNAHHFFDIEISSYLGNWYIEVGKPNRGFIIDIGFRTPDGTFILLARSNAVITPRDSYSEVIDEEWMIPDWERMYALSGGFGLGRGSEEIREMMKQRLEERMGSGWVSSISSPMGPPRQRPFWLIADLEVIVYGATEPTASVTIQGKPIDLRPDGTFSLRFALPDGHYELPIEAVRDDGAEKRKITPIVERRTE